MVQLSKYFSEYEFLRSDTAQANNIDNSWKSHKHKANAIYLCKQYLDLIRVELKAALFISSGYRVDLLNILVNGDPNSKHLKGLAADIYCPDYSIKAVFDIIYQMAKERRLPPIDKCIFYPDESFLHIQVKRNYPEQKFYLFNNEEYIPIYDLSNQPLEKSYALSKTENIN